MTIAMCMIVRNEARDLPEWLAFHAAAGVDAFIIYDNCSTDGTAAVLKAAARVLDIRVVPWPYDTGRAQREAYEHAMAQYRTEFEWIAVLDSDEYLVVHPPHTLRSLLAATQAEAVAVNWAMFGSNGHVQMPGGLVIESFTRRADAGFEANRHVKCIVRPRAVTGYINPHAFDVHGRMVGADGSRMLWLARDGVPQPGLTAVAPTFAVAQVNHYFTRSRSHWLLKTRRSYPNAISLVKLGQFDLYDRNEVEDRSAMRNLAAVRALRATLLRQIAPQAYPAVAPGLRQGQFCPK